MIMERPRPFSD